METAPISRDLLAPEAPDVEPAAERWKRRAVSIPTMLGSTAVAIAGAPLMAAGLAATDLMKGRRRLPRLRLYGVLVQYLFNDSVEIVLSPVLWAMAGFGSRLDTARSRQRHARLQAWSLTVLERRCEQLLGLRLVVSGAEVVDPTPCIMIARHVSLLDASLPALVAQRNAGQDLNVRGVIMREMLSDPGFDLLYGRLGSIFVDRAEGARARTQIEHLGESVAGDELVAIFPEGRLFSEGARDHRLGQLAESDPDRARRLGDLRHVLPPKPGGLLALLSSMPNADVVILRHVGFETIPSLKVLAERAPLNHQIDVELVRIPRSEIPEGEADRIAWLDEVWVATDRWVEERI